MRPVVLASGNPGKLRELAVMLAPLDIEVVAQGALGVTECAETGTTFVENAIAKARNAAHATGLAAIADDSGLVVDALGGAPGVRSARYAGAGASDEDNVRKLLEALEGVPDTARGARFVAAVVYLRSADDPSPIICEGSWAGRITRAPRGHNGFGYDPVFEVAGIGCTSAELEPERKNRASHRGQAMSRLRERLADEP
ncbi:MAG: RdgB/HAM1 family non-canonical purine NTP pyrophosphatase [Gammaproteobacteria bacterium]|nr:RdgB/HAM1 family non-canonical purine NTP pyrophosphatase [Gammaproteobacteria bacterium]